VAVHHRNHIGAASAVHVALFSAAAPAVLDLQVYGLLGEEGHHTVLSAYAGGEVDALIAGDADGSTRVDSGDRSATWNDRNTSGYLPSDVNLDGSVNSADRVWTWNNRNESRAY
jgi:hypothetical protein